MTTTDIATTNDAARLASFADRPVRFSVLRAYGRSAMHGYHARVAEWDQEQTAAMQRGTAVHSLLLGGRKILGYPGAVRRGKEYDAFCEANAGAEILTMTEYDKANRMADAVRAAPYAMPWLAGLAETTLRFKWNGLECRATPDVQGDGFLTELKTSATSDPARFMWHALRMAYPAQLWFQTLGCVKPIKQHMIVCIESKEPYPVTVFQVTERALEAGNKQLVLWSERLKAAEAAAVYQPYSVAVVPLDIPEEGPNLVFPEDEDEAA